MPSDKYIAAAKAGAPSVDLVRMTRRVAEDIYYSLVHWEAAKATGNVSLLRYMDQATLAAEQVVSEGHEGGKNHEWWPIALSNNYSPFLISVPVLAPGLVTKVDIRLKNDDYNGDLFCTIIPNLEEKHIKNPGELRGALQYDLGVPVPKGVEGWVTFDFSHLGIVKEKGTALGILLQPANLESSTRTLQLWVSDSQAGNEPYWGRDKEPSIWQWITKCPEFRMKTQGYKPTGYIEMEFDLEETPGENDQGEWHIASWAEPGASAEFLMWASDTAGDFSGAGKAVVDGSSITQKTRYYKLRAVFTASSSRLAGAGLIEAGPKFSRVDTFARAARPIWGYPNVVGEISISEGEVKPEEGKSTAGKPFLTFTDEDLARRFQEYDYLGEEVVILRGYDYEGFTENDCEVRCRARIADYVQDEKVELETIDLVRELMDKELPQPAEDPKVKTIVNVGDCHPADAVELLLRRAGVRPTLIDTGALIDVKSIARIADIRVRRVIEKKDKLKDLLDNLLSPLLSAVHERGGKIRATRLDWTADPVATITRKHVLRNTEKFTPRLREGRGYNILFYGEKSDIKGQKYYSKGKIKRDLSALRRFQGRGEVLEYPWLGAESEREVDAAVITEDLSYIHASGLPAIEARIDTTFAWLLPGMTVNFYSAKYRRRGVSNTNPLLCHVASVNPQQDGIEIALVVMKDAQSSPPSGEDALGPPEGFTVTEIEGGARVEITESNDPDVKEYRVYESLAGAEKWTLVETWLPEDFSTGKKTWDDTSYTWLGAFDRKVAAVDGVRFSEPLYVRGFRVKSTKLATPECSLFYIHKIFVIRLDSFPSGTEDLVIEHRQAGYAWERIERTGESIRAGYGITAWQPPVTRKVKADYKVSIDYFRVACVDKYGQVGTFCSDLFIPSGPQLGAETEDPPGQCTIEGTPQIVHEAHGNYYRTEVQMIIVLPSADVEYIGSVEIQRQDDGGGGGAYTPPWEKIDVKPLERDGTTPPPEKIDYRDWTQIKPGWKYQYRVRAIGLNGKPGPWSDTVQVTVAEDTTPPDQPTISVVSLPTGIWIQISEPEQGGQTCRDFSHHKIEGNKGSGWVTLDANFRGTVFYKELTADSMEESWQFRVTAYDTSGNPSTVSDVSDATSPGKITAAVIAANAVEADKIKAGAVVADKIGALAVIAGKIASGAVTTGKLYAGAVTAAKIKVGTITADRISATAGLSGGQIHITSGVVFDEDVQIKGQLILAKAGLDEDQSQIRLERISSLGKIRIYGGTELSGEIYGDGPTEHGAAKLWFKHEASDGSWHADLDLRANYTTLKHDDDISLIIDNVSAAGLIMKLRGGLGTFADKIILDAQNNRLDLASGGIVRIDGKQVLAGRQAHIENPSGQVADLDYEARCVIVLITDFLETMGFTETS